MTQIEFLNALKEALQARGVNNVEDVLADYREHFAHGLQNGKSETELSAKLGTPVSIARAYETDSLIAQVKNNNSEFQWAVIFRVLGRMLVIAPFNLIVLFIPGVVIFSMLMAGWSVAVALASVSVAGIAVAFKVGIETLSFWGTLALSSGSLGILGMGVFTGLVMFLFTKFTVLTLMNYLQWNLQFVLEKK